MNQLKPRERARRASETAEQREERLSRKRIRDRATYRRAAQSVEQRQTLVQLRRERLNAESGEKQGTEELPSHLSKERSSGTLRLHCSLSAGRTQECLVIIC